MDSPTITHQGTDEESTSMQYVENLHILYIYILIIYIYVLFQIGVPNTKLTLIGSPASVVPCTNQRTAAQPVFTPPNEIRWLKLWPHPTQGSRSLPRLRNQRVIGLPQAHRNV